MAGRCLRCVALAGPWGATGHAGVLSSVLEGHGGPACLPAYLPAFTEGRPPDCARVESSMTSSPMPRCSAVWGA